MHFMILAGDIMAIVCNDKRDIKLTGKADQLRVDQFLLANPMILQLQKEISFTENGFIAQGSFAGAFIIIGGKRTGNLTCQTSRKRNQSFMVLFKQLHIDTRFAVKAFCPRTGDKLSQISVSNIVFA